MRAAHSLLKSTLVLAVIAPLYAQSAWADTLTLNYERTSLGQTTYSNAATSVPVPSTYNYGHSVAHTDGSVSGTSSGFYDDYIFSVGTGQFDSITSTIDLAGLLGISDLQVRLFSVADASTPGTTGAPGGSTLLEAWSTAVSCGSGCTGTVAVITPYSLGSGMYDLQVRGTTEALGGSYSGVMNLTPVPLPAAFPLLLSGFGLLSRFRRRVG